MYKLDFFKFTFAILVNKGENVHRFALKGQLLEGEKERERAPNNK